MYLWLIFFKRKLLIIKLIKHLWIHFPSCAIVTCCLVRYKSTVLHYIMLPWIHASWFSYKSMWLRNMCNFIKQRILHQNPSMKLLELKYFKFTTKLHVSHEYKFLSRCTFIFYSFAGLTLLAPSTLLSPKFYISFVKVNESNFNCHI